ncbi:methenyl tetrahydrofolate cyclohydrolase / NADP-dependent methylene H4F dehydrogenase [Tieghemostelium lacteum]|uniref:methenyltetrahydrofolate cyclohydrolase n=1 Tax=Tieghemostelium lacteum TaxID=361077 RepID=A0A152A1E7_TIELA|nr:methenyl tetrahydrofolate cyclohydrolase / NADP-dependent methylene H4F dehydrogenase [Tieghemostelium lacteum]|eukprot:KYR00072.1 methenyl tetrahydrofolate cyclohydrolase / NADP-dependent methylene H4F dehydrogenase [Tieghemostelium lacteum]
MISLQQRISRFSLNCCNISRFSRLFSTSSLGQAHKIQKTNPIQTNEQQIQVQPSHQPIKLNGTLLSKHIMESIKKDTDNFKSRSGITPHLVVIYVGDNPQIESYIKMKRIGCEKVGFKFTLDKFTEDINEDQLLKQIAYHSEDPNVNGIIVQLPLPSHIDSHKLIQSIDPKKDVDGLTSVNLGQIFLNKKPLFVPCTPLGIMEIMKAYNIKLQGKHVVVLGRSNLVGRTIATMISQKDMNNPSVLGGATVTLLHKYSKNINLHLRTADVVISATGVAGLVKKENLKNGVILIDVGISQQKDEKTGAIKLVGDIHSDAHSKSLAYTPVPGGVGPLTVTMLLRNVLKSSILQYKISSANIDKKLKSTLN